MRIVITNILILWCIFGFSQGSFHPAAGNSGTTAMYKDSSAFVDWANNCTVTVGLQNIDNPAAGYASVGTASDALGKANGTVISLGDSGYAVLTFHPPIEDRTGYDFAVFENSFSNDFLELATVEVSSDGINYFKFPITTEVQDTVQTDTYGFTDPTKINNLAGKYRGQYGTPFDLAELSASPNLDVNNITHIKITDVIGKINHFEPVTDQFGTAINDPFPTEFPSGGFDLDAVGVINQAPLAIDENNLTIKIFPNPAKNNIHIEVDQATEIWITDLMGKTILYEQLNMGKNQLDISNLSSGLYLVKTKYFTTQLIVE